MRKIIIAASGTSTTTNATGINSFNITKFSSRFPISNHRATAQGRYFNNLAWIIRTDRLSNQDKIDKCDNGDAEILGNRMGTASKNFRRWRSG